MQRKSKPCLAPQKSCQKYSSSIIEEKTLRHYAQRHKDINHHLMIVMVMKVSFIFIYNTDCYGNHKCPHPCMSHPFDLVFLQMFLWCVSWRVSGRRKHCPEVSELCTSHRTENNQTSHKRKAIHPSSCHFFSGKWPELVKETVVLRKPHGPNFH